MGVNFRDLVARKPISLDDLKGKILAVDGYNTLYQFLTTIRSRDGGLLTDSKGRVTSHLIGLFSRTTTLMQKGIKLIFVFDGKVPELKHKELQRRAEVKLEAQKKYEEALSSGDQEEMRKFAPRTARLTKEMVKQAQDLLDSLGVPWVQAPSEGEAQAAHMVRRGDAWAVVSQDFDSLLFGAPRVVQNLSIEGKRKVAGSLAYKQVEPMLINLDDTLKELGISHEKLIWLAILVGTDYAPGGVKGIGPKKGLALVKQHDSVESLFKDLKLEEGVDWKDVLGVFKSILTTDDYQVSWGKVDRVKVHSLLVEEHGFGVERVEKVLDLIAPKKNQSSLGDF